MVDDDVCLWEIVDQLVVLVGQVGLGEIGWVVGILFVIGMGCEWFVCCEGK